MITKLVFPLFLLLSVDGWAQNMCYSTWLDSMSSSTYIASEIMLDEMTLRSEMDSLCCSSCRFYKKNPPNSTDALLSKLSGIAMIRRGNYAWEPTINGLSAGQITVTLDGMRMFGACTDKMDPVSSYVESNNLGSIKLDQGSANAVHGSTIGGSVGFSLKKPIFNQKWVGDVSSRFESVSKGMSHTGSINYGTNNFAIRVNGSLHKYQDYRDGNNGLVFPSGYQKNNFSLSSAIKTKNDNLISFDFLTDNAYDIGYAGLPMDVAFAKARIASLSYLLWSPLPAIEQVEFKLYINNVDHLMDDAQRENLTDRMIMPGQTQTIGAYAHGFLKWGNNQSLETKIDAYRNESFADMVMMVENEKDMYMITWPEVIRNDVGWYGGYSREINKKSSLMLNGRIEYANTSMNNETGRNVFEVFGYNSKDYEQNHLVWNGGMSLSHRFSETLTVTPALNYGERLPTVSEMYGYFLYNAFDGFDYLGNPRIAKEKSTQLSLSSSYSSSDKLNIELQLYHYWFDD